MLSIQVYAAQTLEAVTAMPTQQSIPPPGMQYPQQSADSYPPTYSDVIDTESTKQKEFSDEEDFRKTANPIGQCPMIRILIRLFPLVAESVN